MSEQQKPYQDMPVEMIEVGPIKNMLKGNLSPSKFDGGSSYYSLRLNDKFVLRLTPMSGTRGDFIKGTVVANEYQPREQPAETAATQNRTREFKRTYNGSAAYSAKK